MKESFQLLGILILLFAGPIFGTPHPFLIFIAGTMIMFGGDISIKRKI